MTHELAHIKDAQSGWFSEQDSNLVPGGAFYTEAMQSRSTTPVLEKWFGYIEKKVKTYPTAALKANEMYAQLQALYAGHPELMKEFLPNAYEHYQAENGGTLQESVAKDVSRDVGEGLPETGGQPTTETNTVDESRVPGGVGEAPQSGKLAALANKSLEGTPFKLRNLIADFFTQKSGNDKDVTSHFSHFIPRTSRTSNTSPTLQGISHFFPQGGR